eukprot:6263134-Heterocapsa_arctica.AAC.1
MAAQLWWRFSAFDRFPMKLARLSDPASSETDRAQLAKELFESPPCCLDVDFGLKVQSMFRCAEHMLNDQAFMAGLRLWGATAKCSNMHLERHLAAIKKSLCGTGGKSPKLSAWLVLAIWGSSGRSTGRLPATTAGARQH